jgi:uncharacterized protein YeaO (DUF488 family)
MAIFTKCILDVPSSEDGIRISVMSRHTLNDGKTPDSRITEKSFDLHLPILGPSPSLVGGYYKRGLPWKDFELGYLKEIREEPKISFVRLIAKFGLMTDITLLCIEEKPENCHRRLLLEECLRIEPSLVVEHH